MTTSTVVVVGGGLAGMAAAIRAADDGAHVTLLERAPRLGGATWSFTHDGLTYDNGQHVFMRCYTAYQAFLERIGSAGDVVLQKRMHVPVRRPGGPTANLHRVALPAPLHLAPALARYRHLSVAGRVRVVRTALALGRLDPTDPQLDTCTFGSWLAANGAHPDEIAALWDIVCTPAVNVRAADASMLLATQVLRTGLLDTADGGDIGWSTVPLQQLHAERAACVLHDLGSVVQTRARVTSVHRGRSGRPSVTVGGDTIDADAVVVAVPHESLATIVDPRAIDTAGASDPDGLDSVGGLGRSAIVNVHLLYDRRVMHDDFVAGIDTPVQFVFDTSRTSGAPSGHQSVAISLSAADRYLARPSGDLVRSFAAEMRRLFPAAADAQVVTSLVTRQPAATFRGVPGSAARRPGTATAFDGVLLAGAWTDTGWPATMEGAVRSGNRAADAVAAHLSSNRPTTGGHTDRSSLEPLTVTTGGVS